MYTIYSTDQKLFRNMPLQVRTKNIQDHSHLQDRSAHKDKSNRHGKHQKSQFLKADHREGLQKERSGTKKGRDRTHSQSHLKCSQCEALRVKLKEKEEYFRQIVQIHRKEVALLEHNNNELREELEKLEERAKRAENQLEKLKEEASYSSQIQGGNPYDSFPSMSPIGEPKGLTIIKKLISGQRSTLSELLVVTPQGSQLGPNPFEAGQKQNALRSEFQRLMTQCSMTSNRSLKSSLRKQLAGIANQLSMLSVDEVKE